ncbi:MAG: Uma2 family endonuclease [Armatimonadetes bacterium]|nr:Uma2 family endonuclease [Armatimonadota bacterium]
MTIEAKEITDIYPETDGEPMGETEIHVIATLDLYQSLLHFFRDRQDIYVAADMFLYYEEGNVRARKAPDVMVVRGVEKRRRRTFKTWEELASPCVVFEVTSRSTWVEDTLNKSVLYAGLGVSEYFLFDPLQEYLGQSLLGLRLDGRTYIPIEAREDGTLESLELGVWLKPEDDLLRVIDPATGETVPSLEEAVQAARQESYRATLEARRADAEAERAEAEAERAEAEAERAEAEAERAEAEAQRAEAAEAESERLRALVAELRRKSRD